MNNLIEAQKFRKILSTLTDNRRPAQQSVPAGSNCIVKVVQKTFLQWIDLSYIGRFPVFAHFVIRDGRSKCSLYMNNISSVRNIRVFGYRAFGPDITRIGLWCTHRTRAVYFGFWEPVKRTFHIIWSGIRKDLCFSFWFCVILKSPIPSVFPYHTESSSINNNCDIRL